MNQKKQLFKNTIIIAIGKLGTQIISFFLLSLYTSKLEPGEYGTYDFLTTLSALLIPIITLLMEESMFRFLIDAETEKEKRKVITATVLYTIFGITVFGILAGIVMLILKYEYGLLFILLVISTILIGLSNCLARGNGKIKLYSISNFILGALTIILNIVFIVPLNMGVKGLLLSNVVANLFTAFLMFAKLKLKKYVRKKDISRKTLREMIKYSIPLVPNNISWIIIGVSDRLMLTWIAGSAANGIYSIANKFPYVIYTCYGFFSTAWKESAARILKEENKKAYYNSIYKDIKVFLKAVILGLIAIMPFAFGFFVDASYNEAYVYIPILAISIYFTNMSNFYGGIFTAYKDTKIMGSTTLWSAVLNIVLNLIFIPKFGIYAAAFSTLLSNWIVYVYRRIKLKKYIKLKEKFNILYWLLLAGTIVAYYINNTIINVVVFIIVLVYCIYTNKDFLLGILKNFKRKDSAT